MPHELKSELKIAVGQARGIIEDLQRLGLGEVFCSPVQSDDSRSASVSSLPGANKSLIDIESDLNGCNLCSLAEGRTEIVFGAGNPNAKIVFIGEGPSAQDDQTGVPFADAAGQLLDRILIAMGLTRSDVYLCAIVKCYAKNARHPDTKEIAACAPFLLQQLETIRPEIIVSLGSFTTQTLLQTDLPIEKLRGQWQQYKNIALMPTYHPAYLLQNSSAKREVWDDMKAVLKRINSQQTDSC